VVDKFLPDSIKQARSALGMAGKMGLVPDSIAANMANSGVGLYGQGGTWAGPGAAQGWSAGGAGSLGGWLGSIGTGMSMAFGIPMAMQAAFEDKPSPWISMTQQAIDTGDPIGALLDVIAVRPKAHTDNLTNPYGNTLSQAQGMWDQTARVQKSLDEGIASMDLGDFERSYQRTNTTKNAALFAIRQLLNNVDQSAIDSYIANSPRGNELKKAIAKADRNWEKQVASYNTPEALSDLSF